jgi:hypothetical protein
MPEATAQTPMTLTIWEDEFVSIAKGVFSSSGDMSFFKKGYLQLYVSIGTQSKGQIDSPFQMRII